MTTLELYPADLSCNRTGPVLLGPVLLGHARLGRGPRRVLVLHDWNGDHATYDAVLPWLDGEAFTYVLADLRGYGLSRGLAGTWTIDEIAADCLALADHLGWDRFQVIGHSITGMATQRLALAAPARIAGAVAVCPLSAAGSPAPQAALAAFAATNTDDDAFRRLVAFIAPGLTPRFAAAKLDHCRAAVDPVARAGYHGLFRTDFADRVRGLATPFLVLIGGQDPGLDAAAMQATFLAWHPRAELATMAGCGHYPMQEAPPLFATLVERFLARQEA